MAQIIEHVVLFNVKDDAEPSKVELMVDGLKGIASLGKWMYLSSGVVHGVQSSLFKFTHILHGRFSNKEDLDSYLQHPTHLNLVQEAIRPICDDLMFVDWVANLHAPVVHPSAGALIRVSFFKLKEGVKECDKAQVLKVVGSKGHFRSVNQLTYGENFSVAGKGYSIESIAVFSGKQELASLDSKNILKEQKDKVKDFVEDIFFVDYVVV